MAKFSLFVPLASEKVYYRLLIVSFTLSGQHDTSSVHHKLYNYKKMAVYRKKMAVYRLLIELIRKYQIEIKFIYLHLSSIYYDLLFTEDLRLLSR